MRALTFFFHCWRTKPVWFTHWWCLVLQLRGCCPEGMKGWQGGCFRGLTTLVETSVGCQWVQGVLCPNPGLR